MRQLQSQAAFREESPFVEAIRAQAHVIYALMMHDIKSRFFGNGTGYIVTILWPSSHVVIIVGAFLISGRTIPYGNNTYVYVVTGVLPYIAWNYISRFAQLTTLQNRSYLSYPIVKFLDLIAARLILELVTVSIITASVIISMPIFGADMLPPDTQEAALGLFSAICLGIGFGILSSVLTRIWPLFALVYVGFLIGFWFTAGVAINPEGLPAAIGDIVAWNPLLHSIEMMRLSYFNDAPHRLLSRPYVFEVAGVTATLGLIGERVLRPFFK